MERPDIRHLLRVVPKPRQVYIESVFVHHSQRHGCVHNHLLDAQTGEVLHSSRATVGQMRRYAERRGWRVVRKGGEAS
jgi:hypothetical protein